MTDPRRPPVSRARAAIALALALTACAPRPAPPPVPAPQPLGAAELDALADLLRLEDRRQFDPGVLTSTVASPAPAVRSRAALTLGRLRDARGLPLLVELLEDPDSGVAATAAFALGQLGDTAAVGALSALLSPEATARAPTVAAEAAYALGKLRSATAREALRGVLRGARADDPGATQVVGSALLAIWRFPRENGPDPIGRWTGARDPELRWRATYALVRRPDPAAVSVLQRLSADPDHRVRALAVRGLTRPLADSSGVGSDAVLPHVLRALGDTAYPVRINAIRTLGTYPQTSGVEALLERLATGRHEAYAAAEALGRIGTAAATAVPALRSLALADAAPVALRQAVLESLARIAPAEATRTATALLASPLWRLRAGAARALAVAGADGALHRLVRDPDGRVAAAALQAAVEARGDALRELRPLLLEALGAPDVMLRTTALNALGRLRDPTTLPVLLDAYARAERDSLNDAALAALDALAELRRAGTEPSRALFARFSRPADPLLRLRAQEHFGATAIRAWGDALPIETGRSPAEYRELVERWVAPVLEGGPGPRALLETESGRIVLRLFGADAPLTVGNFAALAADGFFDGQEWPRVVPNFVVQGGDPRGDTSGGPGYSIRDELNRHRYGTGSLGMALSGPDTGGSQFFITHSPQPHLDGIYTIFGQVMEGQDVTEEILPGERIQRIRIEP